MPVGVGQAAEHSDPRGHLPQSIGVPGDVVRWGTCIERLGLGTGRREEQRAEHRVAHPADDALRGMARQADTRPDRHVVRAEARIRELESDGGHVPPMEHVRRGLAEFLGAVCTGSDPLVESE